MPVVPKPLAFLIAATLVVPPASPAGERRPLRVDDLFSLRRVSDPRVSPDGAWVAYTVTTLDAGGDASDTDVWMAPFAEGEAVRLTTSKKSETAPRWSPDGRLLAFLSGHEETARQVHLLDRRGGEAVRAAEYPGGVSDLAWSPDGTRLALVVQDADPEATMASAEEADDGSKTEKKKPRPIVLRRRQTMRDGEGFLGERRRHVHVLDVRSKASVQITSGPFDDEEPAWSPDGRWIAFTSNRSWPDPDANDNLDVFLVPAEGGLPRRVTTAEGPDRFPTVSPDGRWIAYVAGGDPADMWYATTHVAVVPVTGGEPRPLTKALDRNVVAPRFAPEGRHVLFILEDGGNKHLCRVPVAGGAVERVVAGERDVMAFDVGPRGEVAVLESQPHQPAEVSAVAGGTLRRVSRVNDAFLEGVRLGPVERFRARSGDGTWIDGFLTRPPGAAAGVRLPTILWIHGGPVDQYSTELNLEWQLFAAHGYAVVAANPRGSSGHGREFARAIFADWGNKDYEDVMAAVDHAVAAGVADPDRLGVGGWSYGGMLTDYVITKTSRFKAAASGASEVNYLAGYGTDHYQREWETELGLPWRQRDLWIRLSPWFEVDKVATPTLLMCGEDDRNVPLLHSLQLYQALRRLGRETELVIYPGEDHSIDRPSFQKDRYERWLAWYDRFLKPGSPAPSPPPMDAARRARLEEDLARVTADFVKDPESVDALIWLGRRTAYLGRYREAIEIYTRGIAKHPSDFRLYRHRGHRHITLRQLDEAIADLTRASELIRGVPDEVEPDGIPNRRGIPTGTSHFNIYYHLGLALYLKGDFEKAERAYRECLRFSGNPDRLVATSDWLYLTLRRQGRVEEAARILEPIRADLELIEGPVYLDRLRLYKGELRPEDLLAAGGGGVDRATYLYGVGAFHLVNGRTDEAREIFETIVRSEERSAFAVIAAEAELGRTKAR